MEPTSTDTYFLYQNIGPVSAEESKLPGKKLTIFNGMSQQLRPRFLKKTTVPFSATFLFTFKQFYWIKTFGVHATIAQDSSAPSILPPWVWLPSTPSTLLSLNVKFVLYLSLRCEKITKINKKRPGLAHLKKDFSRFQTRIVRVEGLLTATTTASFCYFPDTH